MDLSHKCCSLSESHSRPFNGSAASGSLITERNVSHEKLEKPQHWF